MNNKIKVLHIIPSLRKGGAERLVLDICNELIKRQNIEVKLIILNPENDYLYLSNKIDIININSFVSLSLKEKDNFNIDELDLIINKFKPNIIHSHLFQSEIISRYRLYPNIVYITHLHSNMKSFNKFSILDLFNKRKFTNYYEKKWVIKKYLQCNNHFISISKDTEVFFKKTLPKSLSNNIKLMFNAIDFNRFYNGTERKKNREKVRLINVGSLVDKKNQIFLVDIVDELLKRGINTELIILGSGPNKEKILNKVTSLNLSENIKLLGNVEDVENYLNKSDIYLHSATYEPFGLVLLEAMASGLPCITLDGKGNRDIIIDGINGYMIYKQEIDVFCDKIQNLVNNEELYIKMSNNAIEFARDFDIKIYIDKLVDYYNELLNK